MTLSNAKNLYLYDGIIADGFTVVNGDVTELTEDERLYIAILNRMMREQSISLLHAQLQLLGTINNSVDAIRIKYLKDNGMTVEELAAS